MIPSIRSGSVPGTASTWTRNWPARLSPLLPRIDPGGHLVTLDHGIPQPGTPAAREEVGKDIERRAVGMAERDGVPAEQPPWDRFRVHQPDVAAAELPGFLDEWRGCAIGFARAPELQTGPRDSVKSLRVGSTSPTTTSTAPSGR